MINTRLAARRHGLASVADDLGSDFAMQCLAAKTDKELDEIRLRIERATELLTPASDGTEYQVIAVPLGTVA